MINGFQVETAGRKRRQVSGSPWSIHRLTLELVTVGDFALPVAGLFVQVKGQSAGARDLLQAGFRAPVRVGQKAKGTRFSRIAIEMKGLLSSWSQFFTLVFQSHVCRSMSNARPVGHRTVANLVTPISLALSHLWLSYTLVSLLSNSHLSFPPRSPRQAGRRCRHAFATLTHRRPANENLTSG